MCLAVLPWQPDKVARNTLSVTVISRNITELSKGQTLDIQMIPVSVPSEKALCWDTILLHVCKYKFITSVLKASIMACTSP